MLIGTFNSKVTLIGGVQLQLYLGAYSALKQSLSPIGIKSGFKTPEKSGVRVKMMV